LNYSIKRLGREFARLKRLYTECSRENRPGKRRFAFYEYLYEVYALHSSWRAAIGTNHFRGQIADLASRPMKPDQHLLKLIVDSSCTADHKTRSRWGQALKYVWRRRKRRTMSRDKLSAFLHCNGGVVGCAAKSADPRMKPIEGRLGPGFDSLAFQKSIDSQKSEAVPESAVDGAPTSDV
jgi:hypothetical protein